MNKLKLLAAVIWHACLAKVKALCMNFGILSKIHSKRCKAVIKQKGL